jgi:hypothetical protein
VKWLDATIGRLRGGQREGPRFNRGDDRRWRRSTNLQISSVLKALKDDPALPFAEGCWARQMRTINHKASVNGLRTQGLNVARLTLTIPVPLLAGLGLHGDGATWVRWLTFGLSLGAAVVAAFITICGFEPRWRLYHKYAGLLMDEGWLYVSRAGPYQATAAHPGAAHPGTDPASGQSLAVRFTTRTCKIIDDMNKEYDTIAHKSATGQTVASV